MSERYEIIRTKTRMEAFATCTQCGSVVHNIAAHDRWHDRLNRRLGPIKDSGR